MKKTAIIATLVLSAAVVFMSCGGKRDTGRTYMPDMSESRAYESYAKRSDTLFTIDPADRGHKIFYNAIPPAGTVKRGELFPFSVSHDISVSTIDSNASLVNQLAQIKNPLAPLNHEDSIEAGRLFNINCGICHGAKAEANGPLASKLGGVKSIIAALASPGGFSDGRIFYVMTYGQNNMGSYASQLSREQRWRIVQYIRTLEPKAAVKDAVATAPKTDTVNAKK
jgi:mono/diheme cytochrome c family protein